MRHDRILHHPRWRPDLANVQLARRSPFFVFDPVDPKIIYAGTQALWRSTDGGETWNLVYPKASAVRGVRMNSDHADETIAAEPDPLGAMVALVHPI